jgi:hypothetical protein
MMPRTRAVGWIVPVLVGLSCGACADNATRLAYQVEQAAAALGSQSASAAFTVRYEPVTGGASPYTVLFFPARPVTEAEVVAAGVAKTTAERIYSELSYLGDTADLLVVEQKGERLTFTTSWRRFARVHDLVVSPRMTGESEVVLKRDASDTWIVAVQ